MSEEIAESLREISTPTGLSYSGDRTLDNSYTEKIIDYINSLQQKVEQLENIRKEAIEYVYKHIQEYDVDGTFTNLDEFDFIASPQTLLNILSKGDNNVKD